MSSTYVAQYREGKISGNIPHERLEEEAERSEQREIYDADPYVPLAAGNRMYQVRKSKRERFIKQAADEVERYVREQRNVMEEGEYLGLLKAYEDMLARGI
jgi:high-affinity K+ transport system ATPase subunit B